MKKTFLKFLPLAATVLLATSCSKDENKDEVVTPENQEVEIQNEVKEVPFTVTVGSKQKLSKISYTKEVDANGDELKDVQPEFDAGDVNGLWMIVTGDGINASTLTLSRISEEGGTFAGTLKVTGSPSALTGTITIPHSDDANYSWSATSIADLMSKCGHVYTTDGMTYGGNSTVELVDNMAYLEFILAETQTKFEISTGEYKTFKTNPNGTQSIWIAVEGGTTVSGNLVSRSGREVSGGTIYTLDRTKEVDLGPDFTVLWTTCNLGADSPGEYGLYYAWGDVNGYGVGHNFSTIVYDGTEPLSATNGKDAAAAYATANNWGTGYRMPTGGADSEQADLANCSYKPETQDGNAGYKFYTDYGSVFLPAAGFCYLTGRSHDGSRGYYWSCTPDGESNAHSLRFDSGDSDDAYVSRSGRDCGQSVRAVRCMN